MSTILFIIILYSVTNNVIHCNVYYVTPDDDSCCSNNSSCDRCYNLQHYLLNVSKYFTAHTQLYFLPGLHYLPTNLVIRNVSNISLIGAANGKQTTIRCTGMYQIILSNINSLTIRDLVVTKCGYDISPDVVVAGPHVMSALSFQTVQLHYCSFVAIINVKIVFRTSYDTITNVNTMGNSTFHNVLSAGLVFIYHDNETNIKHHTSVHVLIDNYQCTYRSYFITLKRKRIIINLYQSSFTVHIKILNIKLCYLFNIFVCTESGNYNVIEINSCTFSGEIVHNSVPFFVMTGHHIHEENTAIDIIHFKNCHFINIFRLHPVYSRLLLIDISSYFNILNIVNCTFVNTSNVVPLTISKSKNKLDVDHMYQNITIIIKNTSFVSNTITLRFQNLLTLSEQVLLLDGPVLFKGIQLEFGKLIDSSNAIVQFHNYIEISNCSGSLMFAGLLFSILKSPVIVNVVHNNFQCFSNLYAGEHERFMCMFQYFKEQNLNLLFRNKIKGYSVIFQENKWATEYDLNLGITHCSWLTGSAFNTTIPVDVNQRFISFINETFATSKKGLCYCSKVSAINCYKDQLGPIYPGQTLDIMLAFRYSSFIKLIIDVHDTKLPLTACKISSLEETKQIVTQTCTVVKFTILQIHSHYKWCELIFKTDRLTSNDAFYIKFYPCPAGFSKINGRCQCDPMLTATSLSIDDCDINDQTILRPANSWISATTNNETLTYLLSLDCPFDYCLPYQSRLKLLLTADLQCQFRRHGLLCGQCSDGLSTVFGSSHCQKCSNANIFIIVPIAVLGLLLVVLLFLINLTVADGTINAFILYVNILSINSTVFFHSHDAASKTAYIFISVLNLDMGIQTCFYDGMDDYAKIWLQLLFPLYLIFIATILIMASRYSSRVQRLTARRALPVLATLFLLSYTKILRTVSSVLFFYSSIIHLPSNHIKLVWSVDANVNMFEFRFIALFIVCLVIFIVLIPFNITLLFTRSLARFKLVNKFKPLLDVYQGPFKIKFYYWIGLHLVIKAVFFGLSALDKKVNLLIGSMILIAIEGIFGYTRPYKNWFQNCHEMILLCNLNALYVLVLSGQNVTPVNVMIALAAVQFLFIVIYSIFNYTPANALKSQMQHCKCVHTLVNIIAKRSDNASPNTAIQLHNLSYRDRIPEITYNYSEYQEPLVGVD